MCAAVPGAADPAVAAGHLHGSFDSTSTDPPKPQPCPSRNSVAAAAARRQVVRRHEPHGRRGDSSAAAVAAASGRSGASRAAVETSPPAPDGNTGGRLTPVRPVGELSAAVRRGRYAVANRSSFSAGTQNAGVDHAERLEDRSARNVGERLPRDALDEHARGCRSRCCRARPRPAGASSGTRASAASQVVGQPGRRPRRPRPSSLNSGSTAGREKSDGKPQPARKVSRSSTVIGRAAARRRRRAPTGCRRRRDARARAASARSGRRAPDDPRRRGASRRRR